MHGLRNFRGFGRLLAGWLLLWFLAMAVVTPPALQEVAPAVPLASAAADGADEACGSHAHEARAHAQDADPTLHAHAGDAADAHGGHAAGSAVHCPLCLHSAAPPQSAAMQPARDDAPGLRVAAADAPAPRVRSAAPPPGRGPPFFS